MLYDALCVIARNEAIQKNYEWQKSIIMYNNYGLHRFDGCPTRNLKDANVQLLQISVSDNHLHPSEACDQQILGEEISTICKICS